MNRCGPTLSLFGLLFLVRRYATPRGELASEHRLFRVSLYLENLRAALQLTWSSGSDPVLFLPFLAAIGYQGGV